MKIKNSRKKSRHWQIHKNSHIDKKYHKLYDESKKKDDLSDAYLQGMFYIQKD